MSLQPKPEPGSPPGFTSTNPNSNFEQKPIPDLVNILRGTCQFDTFDTIEGVLVNRDKKLREEIQQLQQKFDLEKLQLREKLQVEVLLRIQAEEEVRKREELCEKGKRVQESYETLLKDVKTNGLADRNVIKELKKKNDELECEVKNLKGKCVDDGNKLDVIRRKNVELESEVLVLRKVKEKSVEDGNELGVLRKMVGELENKILELTKSNEKLVKDNNGFDELRGKVCELEERVKNHMKTISELGEENSNLADKKLTVDILYKLLCTKFRDLQERVSRLEDNTKLWMNVDASDGGNNEGEPWMNVEASDGGNSEGEPWMNADVSDGGNSEGGPPADPVSDFEDNSEEDDTVEAAPLPRIEDAPHSLGDAASTQLQNIGGNDAQGASSAGGRVELVNGIEVINLDDDDDDDVDRSISEGVHGKTATFEIAVKDEYPSSSVATQQNSKFTNAVVDTVKRKFPFPDIETPSSSDDSSNDSFIDNLPISSVVSQGKKTKM
ncbi:hypothetical protein QL285_078658 [Trifolium repens]|nr:hypothetical protein QL285_078658 [Trifolium repens]